jgi:hypothetical protein
MATGPFVFNIAKGKVARYADLPLTNDALILVLLKSTGLESDAILQDYDNLSVLLAAASDECDFTGYTRRTLSSVTVTPDDTGNTMTVDAADPATYTNSGTSQIAGAAIVCYDDDTTGGTDTSLIPLVQLMTGTITFDTSVVNTLSFNASGIFTAS